MLVQESQNLFSHLQVGQTLQCHECSRAPVSSGWGWDLTWTCTLAWCLLFHYLAFPRPYRFLLGTSPWSLELEFSSQGRLWGTRSQTGANGRSLSCFLLLIRVCEVSSLVRGITHPLTYPPKPCHPLKDPEPGEHLQYPLSHPLPAPPSSWGKSNSLRW